VAKKPLAVVLEVTDRKVFASALEWPGWCRAGRDEHAALDALAGYATRYAPVAGQAKISFPAAVADELDVVERLTGNTTTTFGAPAVAAAAEAVRLTPARARRQASLVAAAWHYLDQTVARVPQHLRKGPRGGGRDRDVMYAHVIDAEGAYARKIGIRLKASGATGSGGVGELRHAILAVLGPPADGGPVVENGWTTAYAARRIAWHALDHAWEMEDRSTVD